MPSLAMAARFTAGDDGHVQIIPRHTLADRLDSADLELQIECRMRCPIDRQQLGHEVQSRRGAGAETNAADGPAGAAVHPFAGAIDRGKNVARLLEEDLARDGQRHAPGGPIQQLCADGFLELRDLMRDRRLRHVADGRGAGEVPPLGDRHECLQIREIL
jgi:hypothetical protein